MKYALEVAGQPFEVELTRVDEELWADVDGQRIRVTLQPIAGRALHTLIWGEQRLTLYMEGHGSGYRIQLGGRVYEVELERAAVQALRRHLKARTVAPPERVEVRAHMPGLIIKVEVKHGQQVSTGEGLFVVEAMKMENELRAPCAGTIEEVNATAGQEVKPGELLCVIRPDTP
jgi:biotin carboxyl carrier protein